VAWGVSFKAKIHAQDRRAASPLTALEGIRVGPGRYGIQRAEFTISLRSG
jgi:hypothetical protein